MREIFAAQGIASTSRINEDNFESKEENFPCVTFKGEKIKKPQNIGAKVFGYDDLLTNEAKNKKGTDNEQKKELRNEELSNSSMRQFVFENTQLYNKIKSKLEEIVDWEDDTPETIKKYDEEDSVPWVINRGHKERDFSSLFAYMFTVAPEILEIFLGYKLNSYKVYTEEKFIDVLIRSKDKLVVIENKINADFNKLEKKVWYEFIPKEEKKDDLVAEIKKEFSDDNSAQNQLEKYFKLALYYARLNSSAKKKVECYILCPEYRKKYYESAKKNFGKVGDEYTIKTYNDIAKAIDSCSLNLRDDQKEIINTIRRSIVKYTKTENTYYMERICGRFANKVKELTNNP